MACHASAAWPALIPAVMLVQQLSCRCLQVLGLHWALATPALVQQAHQASQQVRRARHQSMS